MAHALRGQAYTQGNSSGLLARPPNMLFNAHKKTLHALQHSLAQQTSLLNAIERSMAVIEFDLHGNVLRANPIGCSVPRHSPAAPRRAPK